MKKKVIISMLGLFMAFGLVGCSKSSEATHPKKTKVSTSQLDKRTKTTSESVKPEASESQSQSSAETPLISESAVAGEQEAKQEISNELTASTTTETVAGYVQANYSVEGTHFSVKSSIFNQETKRQEFFIDILPNTKEDHEKIMKALNESAFSGGLALMDNVSRQMIDDLPKVYGDVHINYIQYVYYDGSDSVLVVQDRAQDTLK
ncbi:hypothetical protein I6N95_21645 [Vagococcus sp. BWB3-3]|uniref:DUF4358 domain-containing protein n=1 Tax=Vagococcus allomyrinae TaxID=2794353 RepID=A0A940SWU1_9ENTE|nr:hypothetical protein [Vagococcus allomyrinae]MBP1043635.1 hypothetical protein [Vagococcus allomyrinae]